LARHQSIQGDHPWYTLVLGAATLTVIVISRPTSMQKAWHHRDV
jgi:hypothetical protein